MKRGRQTLKRLPSLAVDMPPRLARELIPSRNWGAWCPSWMSWPSIFPARAIRGYSAARRSDLHKVYIMYTHRLAVVGQCCDRVKKNSSRRCCHRPAFRMPARDSLALIEEFA